MTERIMAGFGAAAPTRGRTERLVRDALYVPRSLPPVAAVVAGMDGTIWLKRAGGGRESPWTVLDPDGGVVARVAAPAELSIRQVDGARVWGVVAGRDDVPMVVRYRIRR
jgi:hypothetical protein